HRKLRRQPAHQSSGGVREHALKRPSHRQIGAVLPPPGHRVDVDAVSSIAEVQPAQTQGLGTSRPAHHQFGAPSLVRPATRTLPNTGNDAPAQERSPILWAGTPAQISLAGTLRVTTEFAPITAPSPTVTPAVTTAPAPSHTSLPRRTPTA